MLIPNEKPEACAAFSSKMFARSFATAYVSRPVRARCGGVDADSSDGRRCEGASGKMAKDRWSLAFALDIHWQLSACARSASADVVQRR